MNINIPSYSREEMHKLEKKKRLEGISTSDENNLEKTDADFKAEALKQFNEIVLKMQNEWALKDLERTIIENKHKLKIN